jgi:uncharacterized protein with HEPN domain
MQEAIMHIMKYTSQGRDLFYHDELVQIWVIHHLEIIGEATRTIPDDFRNLHPEIPWKQINAMRNILVHLYFDINLDRVWAVVEQDLPVLKTSQRVEKGRKAELVACAPGDLNLIEGVRRGQVPPLQHVSTG